MTSYLPQVELEETRCLLDCRSHDEQILVGRDRIHNLPGEFAVVKCGACGLMRTNPRPTPATIGFYYPDDYGPYHSTNVRLTATVQSPVHLWKRLLRRIADTDSRKIPALQPGHMLEIGCASGLFLHQMANVGWQVEGVEFSAKASKTARSLGYSVYAGTVETAPEPTSPYDLVVGWMVLEHLHDPIRTLKILHRWTKAGGWLVVSVPDAGSLEFKIFQDAWYALQLPNHLWHYTCRTLHHVLMKGGWKIERMFWHNNPKNLLESLRYCCLDQGWDTVANYFLDIVEGHRQRYARIVLGRLLGMLHASGRMTVWARSV